MRSSLGRRSTRVSIPAFAGSNPSNGHFRARSRALSLAVLFVLAVGVLAVWKTAPASGSQVTDEILANPALSGQLQLIGKRHIASNGSRSTLLYLDSIGRPWAYVRDSATGASTHVQLPQVSGTPWTAVSYVLRTPYDLWVMAGNGPIQLREYRLSGDPLPTSAALLSTTTLGDGDSRPDEIVALSSGALVGVSHQQGSSGPQGLRISYWNPSTAVWSSLDPMTFMSTFASKFVAVQHPADGSVWIFGNPDAWGAIGAVHLTEVSPSLRVDWSTAQFISNADGTFNADPENPDLEVARDPSSGTVTLEYQRAYRKMFSTSPAVTGSYLALASIRSDGTKTFVSLDQYVERVSSLGLVVRTNERWAAYRPIEQDLSFSTLYMRRESGGVWDAPILLGALYSPYTPVLAGSVDTEFIARMADGKVHLFRAGAGGAATPSPSPTDTVSPSPTPTATATTEPSPTPTSTPVAKCKPSKGQKCR